MLKIHNLNRFYIKTIARSASLSANPRASITDSMARLEDVDFVVLDCDDTHFVLMMMTENSFGRTYH